MLVRVDLAVVSYRKPAQILTKEGATTARSTRSWGCAQPCGRLVLLRRFVSSVAFESFAVVGVAGSSIAEQSEGVPGKDVVGGVPDGQDEFGVEASDLVDGQRVQAVVITAAGGTPFVASAARMMVRNAAAAMARVMWAYQAS